MAKSENFNPEYSKSRLELFYIFTFYCGFADRQSYQILKIQSFRKMLNDAQLLVTPTKEENSRFDLLYAKSKIGNSGIDFEGFLRLLPQIVKIVEKNESEEGLKRLIKENFHALYEFILENTDLGECIQLIAKAYFTENCFRVLRELSPTLHRIYSKYFNPNAIKVYLERSEMFKQLSIFSKDYEFTPQIISKAENFIIFNSLFDSEAECAYKQWFEEDKSNKQIFKYFDFLQYILIASGVVHRKMIGMEVSELRKLVNLLEMMEISDGFRKVCKNEQVNLHLIPNEKLIKQLEQHYTIPVSPEKKNLCQLEIDLNDMFLESYNELRRKFISCCLHGETIGTSYLSHKKVIDILKMMEVGLKQSEIEVILANAGKCLEFESFVQILQKVSQKEFIEIEEIIDRFLGITLSSEVEHEKLKTSRINSVSTRSQYRNCLAMIEELADFLHLVFLSECQPNRNKKEEISFITLDSYLKIMHDFELSPLYLSKQSLTEIFRTSIKKSYDFMDFYEFKDSFIIALPFLDLSINEDKKEELVVETKMIIMIERINDSRGAARICRSAPNNFKIDYLIKIRQNYKKFYPEDNVESQQIEEKLREVLI